MNTTTRTTSHAKQDTTIMNANEDANDRMLTFFTGRTKNEMISKERAIKFPLKLMYSLECGDYSHIITWSPPIDGGLSFLILDTSAFEKHVLPALFKVAKFDSFRRKLYRWGFMIKTHKRRGSSNDMMSISHPNFRESDFVLASKMTCSGPGSAANRITGMFTSLPVATSRSNNASLDSNAMTDFVVGATNTFNTTGTSACANSSTPIAFVGGGRTTATTAGVTAATGVQGQYHRAARDLCFGLLRDPADLSMFGNRGMIQRNGIYGRISAERDPSFYQRPRYHHGGSQSENTGMGSQSMTLSSCSSTNPFHLRTLLGMDSAHHQQLQHLIRNAAPQQEGRFSSGVRILSMEDQQSIIRDALDVLQW